MSSERRGFIQRDDAYSRTVSELNKTGFTSDDIFLTMRFSDIHPEEQFVNTLAYGVWQSHLDTGISQCQRMAEALKKLQAGDKTSMPEGQSNYDPEQISDFLAKWKEYDLSKSPDDAKNITVIRNGLWRYNRNLMWCMQAYRPIHLALLNGRYAVGSRTFKALITVDSAMFNREIETDMERGEKRGLHLRSPIGRE